MFKLSEDLLERGYQAVLHHGYSDFFPEPPEFAAVKKGWADLRPLLAEIDLTKHIPFKPLFAFAPKSKINLRLVTLLHPVDLLFYTSLVGEMLQPITAQRVPFHQSIVFSFRAEGAPKSALYASRPSHSEFEAEKLRRASANGDGYMGFADIADFYPRLYQHKVRGALEGCVSVIPGLSQYPGIIEHLLRRLTHDGLSYGIPIGPAASRPLAEAALIEIDNTLLSFGVSFIRYIDDFVMFAPTREKIEWALRTLGALLDKNHGLSLHSAKTGGIIKCSKFAATASGHEQMEDSVEARFSQIVEDHFYDWRSLDDLEEEEKEALNAVDLGSVLEDALDEDEVDYKKVAFILERLSSLERTDLIRIVIDHLPRLYPVAHAIHAFFRNVEPIDAATRQECAEKLIAPIIATGDEQAPEFYAVWVLDLFRFSPLWNQAALLARIFRETQSQAVRRYAALGLSSAGTRSEALAFKDAVHSAEDLTRSAILYASRRLGQDERKHWLKRLELNWFEEFLLKHS